MGKIYLEEQVQCRVIMLCCVLTLVVCEFVASVCSLSDQDLIVV